jgi:diaminohydroxyphosphoribosylaminopyrimidine deaminase/5-amino-6-(5-phosphoribosylamino)uracil reductase
LSIFISMRVISMTDIDFMTQALHLARKGQGRTSPNPMVGAVVVRQGKVIGRGYHQKAGGPHAERIALDQAGTRAQGATLYVNLEPCNHFGRTPPCAELILERRIKKVVFGMPDPNPRVQGGGAEYLRRRGLEVVRGVLEEECRKLNEVFIKWITTGHPFVVLKAAASLDGRIASRTGDSKWISNERSRRLVHRIRNDVDAVLVGIGTVVLDNPLLTVRLERGKIKDPLRIVIDPQLRIPLKARILDDPERTLIISGDQASSRRKKMLESRGVDIITLPLKEGRISIQEMLNTLGGKGITSLLVEGGAGVFGSFLMERQIDKFILFLAPLLIGGHKAKAMIGGEGVARISEALRFKKTAVKMLSGDILVEAYPEK